MMAHAAMVRAYVEKLLEEGFGEEVPAESDGTYPVPGDGLVVVDVDGGGGFAPRVAVRGLVADGVKRSARLLAALNELNAELTYGRVWWHEGQVVAEVGIVAEGVDHDHLRNAIGVVAWLTASLGPDLARRFGGQPSTATSGPDQPRGEGSETPPGTGSEPAPDSPTPAEARRTRRKGRARPPLVAAQPSRPEPGAYGYL